MLMYFYDYATHIYKEPDEVSEDLILPPDFPATTIAPPDPAPYSVVAFDTEKGEWVQQMKTVAECFKEIEKAIDGFIAETVAQKGYASIDSLPKYLVSTNAEFKADAEDALAWVTDVWDKAHELQDAFIAGTLPIMTPEQIIEQLPVLEWRFPPRG